MSRQHLSPNKLASILVVMSMILSGCTGESGDDNDIPSEGENIEEEVVQSSNITQTISIQQSEFCDDTNPHHCLMPFPSASFLEATDDSNSHTGYMLNISGQAIPDTQLSVSESFHILDRLDGFSPSTQIFTAFDKEPDISTMANQYNIGKSLDSDHQSILLNMDTGLPVFHWVENDARAQSDEKKITFLRTIQGLEHNSKYAVAFRNMNDISGSEITPSKAFKALRDGVSTDSPRLESQRQSYEEMFSKLSIAGFERGSLQAAWWFHTASTESILRDVILMKSDAESRLGANGIGCTVENVEENYGNDNNSLRRLTGTFTSPHYMLSQSATTQSSDGSVTLTPMSRDSNFDPLFVENREIDFTMLIPSSLAEKNESGPITIVGHGLFGSGRSYVSDGAGLANKYGTVTLATDFKGWSSDGDQDAMALALVDFEQFQFQQERQIQALINHISMIRTFTGICSDLTYFYHNGTNLVDSETINYLGISLGGLRGPSLMAMIPEIGWGTLWVGGTSFTHQVERSTHYGSSTNSSIFFQILSSTASLPSRNDRAVAIALLQSVWDSTDGETYLPFRSEGLDGIIDPFDMFYLSSMMDAQVTTLSADRAARTGQVPIISGSAYVPFGMETSDGPISGSSAVYFDGDFPPLPSGNENGPMWHHSLAHNLVLEVPAAEKMAYGYLMNGTLDNHCEPTCVFEGDW